MTGIELIEKLKEHFTIESFAYDEIEFDANFSENAIKAQEHKDWWFKQNPQPVYGIENYTEKYNKWYDLYTKLPSNYDIAQKEFSEENNIPSWITVEQYGGEGKGETWYSVKHFPELDIYLRVDGYYQSYDGTSFNGWSCCTVVTPKEKTIIIYS
jgi:hypothetical protein